MATVPLSGTNIRFLSGVPFSSDYKHTRWFDTVTEQTNWFSLRSVVHSIINAKPTYFNMDDRGHYIKVDKQMDDLMNVNYIRFQNTSYNNKWFYAFVDKIVYLNAGATKVYFTLDTLQTWMFEMNFKPSYVVREHCKLWNSDGSPVVNTVDEGLNYGTDYDNVNVTQYTPYGGYKWLVIVAKNSMHIVGEGSIGTTPAPSVIGTPTPLTVYLLPFKDSNTVPSVIDKDGDSIVLTKPTETLTALYLMTVSVDNIVSLYVTDYAGLDVSYSGDTFTFPTSTDTLVNGVKITDGTNECTVLHVEKAGSFKTLLSNLGNKYADYNTVKESKLLMHPYTQLVLDDFKGNRVSLKNEYIQSSNLNLLTKGSLGTSNKTSYGIQNYNYLLSSLGNAMSDENGLINTDPNDVPIITDMLSAFIQGNRNSLQVQRSQTLFNGVTDIIGSGIGMGAAALSGQTGGAAASAMGMVKGTGSTIFGIQAMNAKIQDISNKPPSIAKMGSNSSYTIGNGYDGVYIIKKQIKAEYIKKLESFFNLYGYKVNEVKMPNFHTRQYWNYVQTTSCNITGNFNNEDLNELKSIFDNGITLWHTDDMQNYALENEVI